MKRTKIKKIKKKYEEQKYIFNCSNVHLGYTRRFFVLETVLGFCVFKIQNSGFGSNLFQE